MAIKYFQYGDHSEEKKYQTAVNPDPEVWSCGQVLMPLSTPPPLRN